MNTLVFRESILEIGRALRRPEALALRWRDRNTTQAAPNALVFPLLTLSAILGIAGYGLIMRMHLGPAEMLAALVRVPMAAGMAWLLALPALYIINAALGSRLDLSTTVLAALITVSFGSLAMAASIPITWFFSLAVPDYGIRILVNLVVFSGVGVSMADVFLRVLRALEPDRSVGYGVLWLLLVALMGGELMSLFHVFNL